MKILCLIGCAVFLFSCSQNEEGKDLPLKNTVSEEKNESTASAEDPVGFLSVSRKNDFFVLSLKENEMPPVDTFAACIQNIHVFPSEKAKNKNLQVLLKTNNTDTGIDKTKRIYRLSGESTWVSVATYDLLVFYPGSDTLKYTTLLQPGTSYSIEIEILK